MYTIQTNASGTRSMEISEENLQTIEKYALFQHLIDSNGIVDESVLDKLKLNIRSLITSEEGNNKELHIQPLASITIHLLSTSKTKFQ